MLLISEWSPPPFSIFSMFHLELNGGIQITGSHNPPEYNGFKICINKTTIHGKEIQKIREICEKGKFNKGSGNVDKRSVTLFISWLFKRKPYAGSG